MAFGMPYAMYIGKKVNPIEEGKKMETTQYTGKDLAQMARNTAKRYKLRLVSWEVSITQNKEHFETYVSLQVKGIDANGHDNTINTAL